MHEHPLLKLTVCLLLATTAVNAEQATALRLHAIFSSHMVIQRDKPIKVWGWAKPGDEVTVTLGKESAEATAGSAEPVEVFGYEQDYDGLGKWEVTLAARAASTEPITLTASSGGATVTLENVLIGDVWVMSGQSNMAFAVNKADARDLLPQVNMPLLRFFSIQTNEQASLQDDRALLDRLEALAAPAEAGGKQEQK